MALTKEQALVLAEHAKTNLEQRVFTKDAFIADMRQRGIMNKEYGILANIRNYLIFREAQWGVAVGSSVYGDEYGYCLKKTGKDQYQWRSQTWVEKD